MEDLEKSSKKPRLDENTPCEVCGRFGAMDLGGQHLCVDCYEARGSCCPEFGADDLWEVEEEPPETRLRK